MKKPKCPLVDKVQHCKLEPTFTELKKESHYMLCYWEMMYHLQVPDVKWFLVDVSSISSSSQTCNTGQVATVASHSLNDEHTSLRSTGRLFDAVACLTQITSQCQYTVIITHLQFNVMFKYQRTAPTRLKLWLINVKYCDSIKTLFLKASMLILSGHKSACYIETIQAA